MRPLKEIRDEAIKECNDDNCRSWHVICIIAMEKALKEFRDDIVEQLEDKF